GEPERAGPQRGSILLRAEDLAAGIAPRDLAQLVPAAARRQRAHRRLHAGVEARRGLRRGDDLAVLGKPGKLEREIHRVAEHVGPVLGGRPALRAVSALELALLPAPPLDV